MAIQIEHLTHRYGDRVALDDVSFDVSAGSLFGLLGPNGSGKSTLFKILTTLIRPSNGTARISGADILAEANEVRRRIGVVFQHPSLDKKLTVRENMIHQGHLYGLQGAGLRLRCNELLDRFGIADRANDRAEILSGGLQRRVELAKSMLHKPSVLILDEPSTGLDPGARAALTGYLTELRDHDSVTSFLTTHLMDEADACDRIAILDQGRLIACDSPTDLKKKIGGEVLTLAAKEPEQLAAQIAQRFEVKTTIVDRVISIHDIGGREFVSKLMESFGNQIETMTISKPTLNDVFLRLTGHQFRADQLRDA